MTPDKILENAAELYKEKGKEYGDNWKHVGPVLSVLFRNFLPLKNDLFREGPWYWDRIHLITMIIVKLTRYIAAIETGKDHKDSTRDLVVYAAMLDSLRDDDYIRFPLRDDE